MIILIFKHYIYIMQISVFVFETGVATIEAIIGLTIFRAIFVKNLDNNFHVDIVFTI